MKTNKLVESERVNGPLVTAAKLLELLWPDEDCRPSLRSIRNWTADQVIPGIRVGGLIYYDLDDVRAKLAQRGVKSH